MTKFINLPILTLLISINFVGFVKAANPEHLKQLLDTNQCEGCNLTSANLEGHNLKNANLKNANLKNANLEAANLQGAIIEGVNFEGANLKHTKF